MKKLPISNFVGVDKMSMDISENVKNHIGSIHAGALFVLAESASGYHLETLFPDLKDKVVPLLRESSIKYKKIALGKVTAFASVDDAKLEKFDRQFFKKGRGSVSVDVELKDEDDEVVSVGTFTWFIQIGSDSFSFTQKLLGEAKAVTSYKNPKLF
jgi:acyl-coenzyme A thioesterase PaaI-like protein